MFLVISRLWLDNNIGFLTMFQNLVAGMQLKYSYTQPKE